MSARPRAVETGAAIGTDRYFAAWALVLPVASILVIPFVQGTTPANLFALALLFPPLALLVMPFDGAVRFYKTVFWIVACFVAYTAVAQLALSALTMRHLGALELVDPRDERVVLRTTLFTQSLYLLTGVATFAFVRWFYRAAWDRWLLAGAVLLALYGLYELVFFAVMQRPGDFLSNRMFGAGYHPGSWFQTIALGPIVMQRLKSLTGEPAMYAFTILPFWIYALHTGRTKTQWCLLASLVLTASTTAVLGIATYLAVRILWFRAIDRLSLASAAALLALAGLWALGVDVVVALIDKVLISKLTLASMSGADRFRSFEEGIRYFLAAPPNIQLFGVGWGYTRGSNMFTTLLINVGAVGLAIALALFLYPVLALGSDARSAGLKAAVLVVLVTLMVAVPEYGYPSMWLFLGMAYAAAAAKRPAAARRPARARAPLAGAAGGGTGA
jgi:hypothetical protein